MKKITMIFLLILSFIFCGSFTFRNTISSYCVMDNNTGRVLKGENIHEKMLIASTTKILTCITVIENYDLNKEIKINKCDTLEIGSKVYLAEDEIITIEGLLYALMLRSANDAASALSGNNSDYFIYLMNETAKKIGMYNSVFANASGLDEKEYNLSTAYDMSLLSAYTSKNDVYVSIASAHEKVVKTSRTTYKFINKHKLVLNNEEFIIGKTGFTSRAKRVLVSNYKDDNLDLSIITINDSNDWSHHKALANEITNYDMVKVLDKGIYDSGLNIDYYLYIKEDLVIPLKNNELNKLKLIVKLYTSHAVLEIYLNDEVIINKRLDIYYKNEFEPDMIIEYMF